MKCILLKDIANEMINEDINNVISEFYDYSFLLRENRRLSEFNVKDAINKSDIFIKYLKDKTGDVIGDTSRGIYLKAANALFSTIEKLKSVEKDRNRGKVLNTLAKVVNYLIKNRELTVSSIRGGLVILSLIGSGIADYQKTHNIDSLSDLFDNLGIDVDEIDKLSTMSDQALGDDVLDGVQSSIRGNLPQQMKSLSPAPAPAPAPIKKSV